MQLKLPELSNHLGRTLAPVYLISGDEPLLVQEACDDLMQAAREKGFSERTLMHVERGFHWEELYASAGSLSLFAERKLLDVRLPANRFDKAASQALREYLNEPSPDNLLLLRTGRLEGRQKSSAWFKALDAAGVIVQVWPIGMRELPSWLRNRVAKAGLRLDQDALDALAQRVEGNLLAAVQEIEKLKLLDLPQPIALETLHNAVGDASHYDVFDMIDAALGRQPGRASHMLHVLQQEGIQPLAILGAVTSQLRRILNGGYLPPQRKRLFESARSRLGDTSLRGFLSEASLIDQQVKGMLEGDPWQSLERLLLGLGGLRTTPWLGRNEARLHRF